MGKIRYVCTTCANGFTTDSPSSEPPKKSSIEEEEFRRGFWKRAGELVCEEAFSDVNKRKMMIKMQIDIFLLNDMMKTMADMRSTESSNI
jgi:hypothetical protein